MLKFMKELYNAYGSFFLLEHSLTNLLLIFCTMLNPSLGVMGIVGGASTILFRKVLQFPKLSYNIEVVNGILVGLMIGASYTFNEKTVLITIASGLLVVMTSALTTDTLGRWLKLPVLGTPYVLVSYLVILLAKVIQLPTVNTISFAKAGTIEPVLLSSIGAIYFNPTAIGGTLVLAAIGFSSPYLLFITTISAVLNALILTGLGVAMGSSTFLISLMNAVLTAVILGGLFSKPSTKGAMTALTLSLVATLASLALISLLWPIGLPALASPFLLVTYAALLTFNANRGRTWSSFWLTNPCLPERSIETSTMAKIRGIDENSLALRPPVSGTWQIYQGFFGRHTHKPPWHYSVDLIKTVEGRSFDNGGKSVEDYYCFGKPILAPAYGTVVRLEKSIKDNAPGEVDVVNAWGNFLLIKLDYGGYLKLAHLMEDSLKVDVDSRVVPGQMLAQCGNSGRSPQPHLHMHVQEEASNESTTLPFHLTSVVTKNTDENYSYSLNCQPDENRIISTPQINTAMRNSLDLSVGSILNFKSIALADGISNAIDHKLEVELDSKGQYYLTSNSGAKVAFTKTDELIAFYGRSGPADEFLDSFILAFGITPFVDGKITWQDAPPVRLLKSSNPANLLLQLFSIRGGNIETTYERFWSKSHQKWIQRALHNYHGILNTSQTITEVYICEASGFGAFKVIHNNKTKLLATLVGKGAKADNGIPEWYRESVSA